jgi:hypothetical protein
MNLKFLPIFKNGLLANFGLLLILAGCASPPQTVRAPAARPPAQTLAKAAPTALNAEAESALKAAEQSVIEARIQRSLWTAAVEELDKAQLAAKSFDSEATLLHAHEAIALCALSLQQKKAPPVGW